MYGQYTLEQFLSDEETSVVEVHPVNESGASSKEITSADSTLLFASMSDDAIRSSARWDLICVSSCRVAVNSGSALSIAISALQKGH